MAEAGIELSVEVEEADWIAGRLSAFTSGVATSVVPGGFEAYARVLHPVQASTSSEDVLVRWADVSAWSGVPLVPGVHFVDLSLPEREPIEDEPGSLGSGLTEGSLYPADAAALADVLASHTTTPDRCWYCVWEGWGPSSPGPRVRLPGRDYLLFAGPLAEFSSLVKTQQDHTPNLWWPDDRAWCVATEVDLPWTYVGGARSLVASLLSDDRIEAQPASPDDNHHSRVPSWLSPVIEQATTEVLEVGKASFHIWKGSVEAQLRRPQADTDGSLYVKREGQTNRGSGSQRIRAGDAHRLRTIVKQTLVSAVIELR